MEPTAWASPGEVDVDLVLRHDAGLAAAGAAALDAEDGAEGRLAEVDDGLVAQAAQPVGQADGGGGLAFAGRGGRDAGYDDQLAARPVFPDRVKAHLGLGIAEGDQVLAVQAQAVGYNVDWVHGNVLR